MTGPTTSWSARARSELGATVRRKRLSSGHRQTQIANAVEPPALAERGDRVHAEHPVALELRFVEPLFRRRLLRKRRVRPRVVGHIDRLVAGERRLEIDEDAVLRLRIDRRIANRADGPSRRFRRDIWSDMNAA